MKVLVTGGAGYIGSHTVRELLDSGHRVMVLDNLSTGHEDAVDRRAGFIRGDVEDVDLMVEKLIHHQVEAVIDLVPGKRTEDLLEAMKLAGVDRLISATIEETEIPEDAELSLTLFQLPHVAGASPDATIGEAHRLEKHLIPRILSAGKAGKTFRHAEGERSFSFVHVMDVAQALTLALRNQSSGKRKTFVLGTGREFTVQDVVEASERVTGRKIVVEALETGEIEHHSPGKPSRELSTDLGWEPRFPELETMVAHAWNWHITHPRGYAPEIEKSHFVLMEMASEEFRMAETFRYYGE